MPAVNSKGYQSTDYSFKNGAYIVTPYTTEIKVGKSGKRGLYLIFIIVASVDPNGANAVGRTVLKWIDIESDRGANELAFVAMTFGLEVEGNSSDEEFVNGIFNSDDPNANYYIRAMLSEVERPGTDGRVFQSLEIDTSRKTREPMLSPLSNAEITLIPDDDKVKEIYDKAQAAAVAKENRRKSGSYGGGQQASQPTRAPAYDDGFGSSGGTVPYNDEDVPF